MYHLKFVNCVLNVFTQLFYVHLLHQQNLICFSEITLGCLSGASVFVY